MFFSKKNPTSFPWKSLISSEQIELLVQESFSKPILIFKHSTRCGISRMALRNFEKEWDNSLEVSLYFIDLLANRSISAETTQYFGIQHESPQILLIKEGKVIYHASHGSINSSKIEEFLLK